MDVVKADDVQQWGLLWNAHAIRMPAVTGALSHGYLRLTGFSLLE